MQIHGNLVVHGGDKQIICILYLENVQTPADDMNAGIPRNAGMRVWSQIGVSFLNFFLSPRVVGKKSWPWGKTLFQQTLARRRAKIILYAVQK